MNQTFFLRSETRKMQRNQFVSHTFKTENKKADARHGIAAIFMACIFMTTSASANDLVNDDFKDGDYTKNPVWQDDGTAWEVIEEDGAKILKAPGGYKGHTLKTKFEPCEGDWKLTLKFAEAAGGQDNSMYSACIGSEKTGESIRLNLNDSGMGWLFAPPNKSQFIEQINYGKPQNAWNELLIAWQSSSKILTIKIVRNGEEAYAKELALKQGIKMIDFLELKTHNFDYEKGCFSEVKLVTGK